jgi:hypothetical protein
MRKFSSLGVVVGLAVFIIPSAALGAGRASGGDCDYAKKPPQTVSVPIVDTGPNGNQVYAYAGSGVSGDPSITAVGACINLTNAVTDGGANRFDGGTVEAGATLTKGALPTGSGPGAYAIVDGDSNNGFQGAPGGTGANADRGYIGVSNVETGTSRDTSCDGTDSGNGSNSGGCVGLKTPGQQLPIPLIVCGNTSGDQWESSARDACYIP